MSTVGGIVEKMLIHPYAEIPIWPLQMMFAKDFFKGQGKYLWNIKVQKYDSKLCVYNVVSVNFKLGEDWKKTKMFVGVFIGCKIIFDF